jgi:hypothetical protein
MTPRISLSSVAELLAGHGYDIAESSEGLLRVTDVHSGVAFQAALEGNVLFMTVHLKTVPKSELAAPFLQQLLAGDNGISTSSFKLYDTADGRTAITLSNFCTLQNLAAEDQDDVLSLAGYLMADVIAARDLLEPAHAA